MCTMRLQLSLRKRQLVNLTAQSLNQRVAKLAGIDVALINELKLNLPLMPGITELCSIKRYRQRLAGASGGFVPFAEHVQSLIGLDEVHANTLEFKDNRLTGKVTGTIVDAEQKARVLEQIQQKSGLITVKPLPWVMARMI